jgi:ankyrin repeat protein
MVIYNINEHIFNAITNGDLYEIQSLFSEKRKSIDLSFRNKGDKIRNSFLIQACKCNNYYIAQYLINKRVKVNGQNALGETALIYACKNRNLEMVQLLINNNADVNIETKQGNTPLIYACYELYVYKPIVKILLDHGANLFKQNNHGRTPLMMACEGYALDVVELILSYYQRHCGNIIVPFLMD